MLNRDTLLVYKSLQQTVLNANDDEAAVNSLLLKIWQELAKLGYTYEFLSVLLLDANTKLVKTLLIHRADANTVVELNQAQINENNCPLNIQAVLDDQTLLKKLQTNQAVVSENVAMYCIAKNQVAGFQTLLFSPVVVADKIFSIVSLTTIRHASAITEEEQELIGLFTNLIGIAVHLKDTQGSLTEITQEMYNVNAKLHQLDKLKDDFVSVASHELRTPMTAIKSYIWMALNKKKQEIGPDLSRYLNNAYVATDRLITLVNDMLNVSRIEGGRISLILKPTNLVDLANLVVEEVAPKAAEKQIQLAINPTTIPQVLCDEDKIHEVFLNLIGNSLKFTPNTGKVMISFAVKDQFVAATVSDTGSGIAPEDAPRLFSKFGRLANSYVAMAESSGGTGLGLYICKLLISLHKGEILAHSEGKGRGAQFTFTLPIVGTTTAEQLTKETPPPSKDAKQLEHTVIRI